MQPHLQYTLLFFLVVAAVVIAVGYRREIRFRWNYGMWPRETGVERIVTRRLENLFAKRRRVWEEIHKAEEALRRCPDDVFAIRAKSKALWKIKRASRRLDNRIAVLCAFADKFGHAHRVNIDEESDRQKARAGVRVISRAKVGNAMMEI